MGGNKSRGRKSGGEIEMKKGIIWLLEFYKKYLSRGEHCRFSPSCSVYCKQAVEKYGVVVGFRKGIWRVMRCNRWSKGGVDEA